MDSSFYLQGQPLNTTTSQPQNENLTSNTSHTCEICNKPSDCSNNIFCNKCKLPFHISCVNAKIDNAKSKQTWLCQNCSQQNKPPSDCSSISRSSSASRSKNPALELQRLEEETKLEREFLRKKYQILENAENDENDEAPESASVHQWLNKKSNNAEQFTIVNEEANHASSRQNGLNESNNYVTCPQNTVEPNLPLSTEIHVSTNNNVSTMQSNLINKTSQNNMTSNCPPFINTRENVSQFNTQHVNQMFNQNASTTHGYAQQPLSFSYNQQPSINFCPNFKAPYRPINNAPPPNILNSEQTFSTHPSTIPSYMSNYNNLTQQQMNARQTVPKELPTFTGMPEEWPLFSSTYDWSTKICGLTNAENLVRLQKALRGEALRSVHHILIHPSCVSAAMATLKLLYGQPEKILNSLKRRIKLLPLLNTNNLQTITSFAVEVKGLETTINACNLTDELNNSSLLQELIVKMPPQFQLNWGSHKTELMKNNLKVNLKVFADWIYDVGLSASSINVDDNNYKANSTELKKKSKNVYVNTHEEHIKKSCLLCKENCFSAAKCKKFLEANRNERWNMVRTHSLCKLCLRRHYGVCKSNIVCKFKECKSKHNSLLHNSANDNIQITSNQNQNKNININTHATHNINDNGTVLFKIIPIVIYGANGKNVETFAFIDEGSSVSLIDENIVHELQMAGTPEPLCLKWTANMERNEKSSKRINLKISGPNKVKHYLEVRSVKKLSLPNQSIDYKSLCIQYPHLKGLPVDNYKNATPSVLLGINNVKFCIPRKVKEGNVNEPIAMKTRLGWLLCGNSVTTLPNKFEYNFHICECNQSNDKKLNELIKMFYSIEMTGISHTAPLVGKDDQRALNILNKHTKQLDNGHYETSLLWKFDNVHLPQSFDMAMKRLQCLEKAMKSNKDLQTIFENTISEYLKKGFITKINKSNSNDNLSHNTWYLPIFSVFNKNKPNKTRVVWDAAAKSKGISLNCMLLKGPDMLTSLASILFQFRERKVAICGDIEQMFHQIFIRKEDRNAQRFLWRSDKNKEPDVYIMNVLIFGASCSPCISQYVKNLNACKYENKYPKAAAAIKDNHYVDDLLISTDSPEEASKLAHEVKYIHSQAGFNIRNWCSNSKYVLESLHANKVQSKMCLNISDGLETEKVLGVFWIPTADTITFKISPSILNSETFINKKEPTKREVLKILMSIYDPLGLIGNFIMYLKVVLQEIWRSGVGWDEHILQQQLIKWKNWLSLLPHLKNVSIPRCYLHDFKTYKNLDVQLHTFVDASENGYAAVSYFRIFDGKNAVVSLIGSKTRVSPLRVASIPRLELMAALIGARFAKYIAQNHSIIINRKVFWSDSQTVLSWIRSDHRKYHQFVAVRISEILEGSEMNEWFWIAGKNNVADEATKWAKKPDLSSSSRWLNGPEFLKLPEKDWQLKLLNFTQTDVDLKQHNLTIQHTEPLIEVERFSRWRRAVRSVAYVIRFCNIIRNPTNIQNGTELTQKELLKAEITLLKQSQQQSFSNEIQCIEKNKNLPKTSILYKLSPFIDEDGVLRVSGRIENANISDEFKHPVILPKYCYITKLIILHFHNIYHHLNYETLINEVRQKYYIPKLRVACKFFIKQCQACKINKAAPLLPQMAKLPRARLTSFQSPFTFTGVDFFGPIFVIVNRHKEKRYGALFTCLTIRAVHIEIVHSLNTSSCIMAIRNFTARRGQPREYFSDNGTNFVGAERELREAIKKVDKNELFRNFTSSTTKWNFNPPAAPHMGGAWERLVRSVKTIFYQMKPERYPDDETLKSMMAEVENIVNSRPLTYVPVESENDEAITPNHFLLGSSSGIKPLATYNDDGVVLKECWLRCQQYADKFWKRWVAEYLPTLTCRTKWFEKAHPLAVGQLVVVVDPANPRNVWPKGKIIEVHMSEDGQVRKAKVMTTCGILERPAAKLAVLDVA